MSPSPATAPQPPDEGAALPPAPCRLRDAAEGDLDAIEAIQIAWYRDDGYPRDPARARRAIEELLRHRDWGRLRVVEPLGHAGLVAGYALVAFGYSFEFHGRDAFLDELAIDAAWRGRGFGTAVLRDAITLCAEEGIVRLALEVEADKPGTIDLYRRHGFVEHGRLLLSRRP